MVTEVASIPVKAGQEEAFIRVFKTAIVPVYKAIIRSSTAAVRLVAAWPAPAAKRCGHVS